MAENQKELDPNDPTMTASPEALEAMRKGRGLGILRMNGTAYAIGTVVLVLFMAVWLISSMGEKSSKQEEEAVQQEADGSTKFADELLAKNARTAGIMQPEPTPASMPEIQGNGMVNARPPMFGPQPVQQPEPVPQPMPQPPSEDELQARAEARQLVQDRYRNFTQAVNSETGVSMNGKMGNMTGGSGVNPSSGSPLSGTIAEVERLRSDYQSRINEARARLTAAQSGNMSGFGGGITGSDPLASDRHMQIGSRAPNDDVWSLNSQMVPPKPYEISTGFVIPATMITGINSDLPGSIQAQVSQNVYDTATGNSLLIPQGTKLYGVYSSNIAFGQSRVLVAWNRLIFPDGRKLDIGEMPGATSAGYSGFEDKVNNHYFRLFGAAFLMSGITAGITYSQDRNDDNGNDSTTASDAMSEALGQQLGQVAAQLIQKHLNVAPTIEIRPGFRFNVIVTKDIAFDRPYKDFDY